MHRRREEAAKKATEIKDQAREVAGHSGEALKAFAEETGIAAKDFAVKARDAAKELVDAIEKAAKNATEPEPKKSRRVLKMTLAIGAGLAVFTNERARNAISAVIKRSRDAGDQPEVWRPETTTTPSDGKTTAKAIAEETS